MQTVDDVHAMTHRFKNESALVFRQHTTGGRHPENEGIGHGSCLCQGVIEISTDGDGVGLVVEHHTGIKTSLLAVDHRKNFVFLRAPDKPIGGFPVKGAEVGFTVDDRGGESGRCRPRAAVPGDWFKVRDRRD